MPFSREFAMFWATMASFVAFNGYMVGTAIRDFVKYWKRRRVEQQQQQTPYNQVVNGETRSGWKLVIPVSCLDGDDTAHKYMIPVNWAIETSDEEEAIGNDTILLRTCHQEPTGGRIMIFTRYSTVCPAVNGVVMRQIRFDPKLWTHRCSNYVSLRYVASVFQYGETSRYKAVIFDSFRFDPAIEFTFQNPVSNDSHVHMTYVDRRKRTFNVIYGTSVAPEEGNDDPQARERYEMHVVNYKLNDTLTGLLNNGIDDSSHSISVPMAEPWRSWKESNIYCDDSRTLTVMDNGLPFKFFTLDRSGQWFVESYEQWEHHYDRTTSMNASRGAWRSFRSLIVPRDKWYNVRENWPLLQVGNLLQTRPICGAYFAITRDGVFRQWRRKPPALATLAAEATCRVHLDFVKSATRAQLLEAFKYDPLVGFPVAIDDMVRITVDLAT